MAAIVFISGLTCGQNCAFGVNGLIQMFESKIVIGNNFTIERGYTIRALRNSKIEIGEDCMLSYNINNIIGNNKLLATGGTLNIKSGDLLISSDSSISKNVSTNITINSISLCMSFIFIRTLSSSPLIHR